MIMKNHIHDSLKSITTMPVCLKRSFTFTDASARRVEILRIIEELIPPPFRQQPLGSSNGGPQTLLMVKVFISFALPVFSWGLHTINYLRQINIFPVYFGGICSRVYWIRYKHLHLPVIGASTGHREATGSRWRWPNSPRSFAIRNARPFLPIS